MGIGVNTRTAFSLLFPPILTEFGWERGVTAGAFSVGFMASTVYAPFLGMLMDRLGPRGVLPLGVVLVSLGMALATLVSQPWHLYLTLGVLVATPHWSDGLAASVHIVIGAHARRNFWHVKPGLEFRGRLWPAAPWPGVRCDWKLCAGFLAGYCLESDFHRSYLAGSPT
jgi:MFS family permease